VQSVGDLDTLAVMTAITRAAVQLAPPIVLDSAFADPDYVLELLHRGAPYKSIAAVHRDPETARPAPWFRNFWALGGEVLFPGTERVFKNPSFIEAAKENFGAKVILPLAMMTNLNPPAPAASPHLDLPFFRGAHQREIPAWLLAPMGYSGLFQRWAIPVASAVSWFYEGAGGEFEYWPDGFDAPSRAVRGLSNNAAVVADNEYMYHRVCRIGEEEAFLPGNEVPYRSMLHRDGDDWVIVDGEEVLARYPRGQVRLSVLWKAFCFADQAEADAYAEGKDKLTPEQVVEIFQADLKRRGVRVEAPVSLAGNDAWAEAIRDTYGASAY
jgi:hypothetical protein